MLKRSIFSSAVRTRVFNWFSIMWFTMTVATTAVMADVAVRTTPDMVVRCGDNVTLTCNATSDELLDVKLFSWISPNKTLFDSKIKNNDSAVVCLNKTDNSHHKLTLTLLNIMPIHQGQYICKFRGQVGINSSTTNITVQDCLGNQNYFINESIAECWFHGVSSPGKIQWFKGDDRLTDSIRSNEKVDQYGRYNITSTIKAPRGNQIYNCSLWILGKYVSSQKVVMVKESKNASESKYKLQWICLMLHAIVVTFIM
ncbi:uncharacterized protein LOC133465949 [Phyllopteryx taeniolatus]|uniref:uncharacterized protein LOC133465949 n=1 Tax=Phyllopteryx taeniolatus TaxID=161469 RepID=UPI002AD4A04B|nr:uncharacterized protein LOC133465949 [Phyllopteryx taeniolatus]